MTSTGYSSIHDPVLWDGKGSALSLEGALIAPNALNFANIIRLPGRVYPFGWDEAMREAPENALAMRRDAFYRGLMQERTSKTINLEWQVACENDGDPIQVMERDTMARCWRQTPDKIGLITWLLEAIWFGRAAQQGQWGKQEGGLTGWTFHEPVHGDSVQFAWDNVPVVLVSQYTAQKYQQLDPDAIVSATDRGSYGLRLYKPEYRNRFIVHKHVREAADYFEGEMSGGVHGVGLRSWCYWSGFMKRETMAWMTNFMQSTGMMDLLLFNYPDGNAQAKAKAEENAKKITGKIALLSPYNPALERKPAVEQIPMNAAGVQVLKELVETYYDRHIERLFVGQSMSAGGGASGGLEGSGRAEFAADTKSEIQLTDANRLGETLTTDWLRHAYRFNFPVGKSILRMEPVLDDPQAETKVQNFQVLNSAGIAIEEDEVITAAGFRVPRPGRKLTKPQMPQADPTVQGGTVGGKNADPPPVPGSPEDPHAVPSQEPMPEGLDPNTSYVDPDVMETAAVLLAVLKAAGLDDDAAELEGLMADPDAADDLAAYVSDNGEPMEQYQWHDVGEQYREIGEVWQGKSGRFFTRNRAGRTVPAKNPNAVEKPPRDPAQPTPQARAKTLAAGREPARQTARDVYAKARQAPHTLTHADVHGLAAHLDTLTRDELREHAREALRKVGGLKAELVKRLVGRIAGEKAAADVWGEMTPGEGEKGQKEPRPEGQLSRLPDTPEEAEALAEAARNTRFGKECAVDGDCLGASEMIRSLHPDAELWFGNYKGEAGHQITKLGDYFIDITADQFGDEPVKVFTQEQLENGQVPEYSGFRRSKTAEEIADRVPSMLSGNAAITEMMGKSKAAKGMLGAHIDTEHRDKSRKKASEKEAADEAIAEARRNEFERSRREEGEREKKEKDAKAAIPLEQLTGGDLYNRAVAAGVKLSFGEMQKLTEPGANAAAQATIEDAVRRRILAATQSVATPKEKEPQPAPINTKDYESVRPIDLSTGEYGEPTSDSTHALPHGGAALLRTSPYREPVVRVPYPKASAKNPEHAAHREIPEGKFKAIAQQFKDAGVPLTELPAALAAGHGTDKDAATRVGEYLTTKGWKSPEEPRPNESAPDADPQSVGTHKASGLEFAVDGDTVHVSGNDAAHEAALKAAGFKYVRPEEWNEDAPMRPGAKLPGGYWAGTLDNAVNLDVPRSHDIPDLLGVRTKSKVSGKKVVVGGRQVSPPKAPAATPSIADTEAELRAEIEKDKTPNGKTEAERHAEIQPLLDRIKATHTPQEIKELAHKVTGEKRGRNVEDWLHMLRADMTAVTRLVNSQNV